jgi:hypothetical protein
MPVVEGVDLCLWSDIGRVFFLDASSDASLTSEVVGPPPSCK